MARLKERLAEGWTYGQIGAELGLSAQQLQTAAQRHKLIKRKRQHGIAATGCEIAPIIGDCLEAHCIPMRQVVDYLAAIGHPSSYKSVRCLVMDAGRRAAPGPKKRPAPRY